MADWKTIAEIRRQYGDLILDDALIDKDPFNQFKHWFEEVLNSEKSDPTAMVLATVDKNGHPDARVVLLKGLDDEAFIFYTNYESNKAQQLKHNPCAALNFYWPQMARQVRVRGCVTPTTPEQSDQYFSQRPRESQLSALASPQSRVIRNREALDNLYHETYSQYSRRDIPRPPHWGGYALKPEEMEFWQGRNNRLHDRIQYYKENNQWHTRRLAP